MNYPPWQSMETALKDRDILAIWEFQNSTGETRKYVCVSSFDGGL